MRALICAALLLALACLGAQTALCLCDLVVKSVLPISESVPPAVLAPVAAGLWPKNPNLCVLAALRLCVKSVYLQHSFAHHSAA